MGLLDWMKAATGRKQRRGTGLEISRWTHAPPRRGSPQLIAAYKEMPWLRTVVDTVADSVGGACWTVVRHVDKTTRQPKKNYALAHARGDHRRHRMKALRDAGEIVEVTDHPILALLADPSDFFTGHDVHMLQQRYLDVVGEAFYVLERVSGVPIGMWPVPPHSVRQLPDLSKPKAERYYLIVIGSVSREIPAADVIHMRHLDLDDPLGRGAGVAFALGDELDTDEYAARFVKNSFWNSMRPSAIAAVEGARPNDPAVQSWVESMKREHQGPENAGKTLVVGGKVSIARFDTSFKEMELVPLRKFLMDFVRMTYRVPPEVVGDISSSNKATIFAARLIQAEQVTVPRLEFMRAHFQKWLMPLFGDDAILEYESPVPEDREHELRVMGTLPEAFSYDEWRAAAGKKPDPNRQGYPMPLPGQKPGGQQTPEAAPGSAVEAQEEGTKGDPPWARQPLK